MWAIIKLDSKKYNLFKEDLYKKLGNTFKIYKPQIIIQRYTKNIIYASK